MEKQAEAAGKSVEFATTRAALEELIGEQQTQALDNKVKNLEHSLEDLESIVKHLETAD